MGVPLAVTSQHGIGTGTGTGIPSQGAAVSAAAINYSEYYLGPVGKTCTEACSLLGRFVRMLYAAHRLMSVLVCVSPVASSLTTDIHACCRAALPVQLGHGSVGRWYHDSPS